MVQVKGDLLELDSSDLDLGQLQHVVDQSQQVLAAATNGRQALPLLGREAGIAA